MLLETKNLTKIYDDHIVLDAINLQLEEKSVYGLVGPNGAGKTTLLSILAGVRRKTAGDIVMAIGQADVAVCADSPEFEPWLRVHEVIELAAELIGAKPNKDKFLDLLRTAGLGDAINRRVGGCSRGMLQRLALASTLVGNPKLIILDEPSSALDPKGRVEVLDMITHMSKNTTVLFSSHILADVQRVCDTVGILKEGHMLYQGSIETFLTQNLSPEWEITIRNPDKTFSKSLQQHAWITKVTAESATSYKITVRSTEEAETKLVQALADTNVRLISMTPVDNDLEHAFLSLTDSKDPV